MVKTLNPNISNGYFTDAVRYTIGNEQGYVNDPVDSGGPTKYGITQQTLSRHRGQSCTVHDVQALNEGEAMAIYFQHYWQPLTLNKVNKRPAAIAIFDTGVLYGTRRSILMAQQALLSSGHITTANFMMDGHMGLVTARELNACPSRVFLEFFHAEILKRIEQIIIKKPPQKKFQNGWINRTNKLLSIDD